MTENNILNLAKRIKSIADIGLLYSTNEYDLDRYKELQSISIELMSTLTSTPISTIKNFYTEGNDYPTPKVDVRGLALNEKQQVLLVQESIDGCWSLPGGWADIGLSPAEVIVKEFKEETGLGVAAKQLLAVFDKRHHNHPPQPYYVYKVIFHCELLTVNINKGFDILDVAYFNIDKLPPLSQNRILKSQIEMLYKKIISKDVVALFD